jgi:hypothetical protein
MIQTNNNKKKNNKKNKIKLKVALYLKEATPHNKTYNPFKGNK